MATTRWKTSASPGPGFCQSCGRQKGIRRYGHAYVPLDEALSRVVIDFSGRPGLHVDIPFTSGSIGGFDTQLTFEFFQGFVNHAGVTLHIDNLKGANAHHQCETVFRLLPEPCVPRWSAIPAWPASSHRPRVHCEPAIYRGRD